MTKLTHGSYSWEMIYDIEQHKYVGGEGGYCEMLEIKNPPEGKCGFVINMYGQGGGYRVWEYPTLEDAMTAWPDIFPPMRISALAITGHCIRALDWSGDGTAPWFYARAAEEAEGDDFFVLSTS